MTQFVGSYLLGNILVGLTWYIFLRLMRNEPNLAARRQRVLDLGKRSNRVEAGQIEITKSKSEVEGVKKRQVEVEQAKRDQVPSEQPPGKKWAFACAVVILAEFEASVFWLLNSNAGFLGLGSEAWAVLAPPFAAAWIFLLHVLGGSWLTDNNRPEYTVRRAELGAALSFVAVFMGVWLTLSGRSLSETNLIEQFTNLGLLILAILLSVCSAFCAVVATTLFGAEQHDRELERLQNLLDLYSHHLQLLQRDLDRVQVATVVDPSKEAMAGVRAATAVLLIIAAGFSCAAQAQATRVPMITEAQRGLVMSFARSGACEIVADVTSSEKRDALQSTLERVAEDLPMIIDALNCKLVRLTPFAGDLFVSLEEFDIPPVADPLAGCNGTNTSSFGLQPADVLYPRVANARQQQVLKACVGRQRAAAEPKLAERNARLAHIEERLRAVGDLAPRGPCTAIFQVVQRALKRSQNLLVITDGLASCAPPTMVITPTPSDSGILFLLIPPASRDSLDRANMVLGRLGALERTFPGASALLAPEATPAFWHNLHDAQ